MEAQRRCGTSKLLVIAVISWWSHLHASVPSKPAVWYSTITTPVASVHESTHWRRIDFTAELHYRHSVLSGKGWVGMTARAWSVFVQQDV